MASFPRDLASTERAGSGALKPLDGGELKDPAPGSLVRPNLSGGGLSLPPDSPAHRLTNFSDVEEDLLADRYYEWLELDDKDEEFMCEWSYLSA